MTDEQVQALIDERDEARKRNDWVRADAIRDILLLDNVQIKDRANRTTWMRIHPKIKT
jgi:cysteinyl-tRNA synthetase